MRRVLSLSAAAAASLLLVACETTPPPAPPRPAPPPPPPPTPADEFSWSAARGANSLTAVVAYRPVVNEQWSCAGLPVALMPETSYSRGRMMTLYGSAERALQSVAQVRARSAVTSGPDYSQFVRSTACDAQDTFTFANLPDGPWFVIAQVRRGRTPGTPGEMVIMQRVELRGGAPVRITLPQGAPPPRAAAPAPAPRPAAPRPAAPRPRPR
jgi:hypothetical protein